MNVNRVILSWPTLLSAPAVGSGDTAPRSLVQIARTGSFVSSRYGKFSITRDDLAQMLHNFNNVTPKAPTELPVDFDHLSLSPSKPFDGIAAGWMKKLELRDNGETLWAEVEWTPKAAEAIKNREYQFVSPSFVKDHVHKDGTKIGTTLIAFAITNHPFLEGMAALTLATPALAGVHLHAALRDLVAAPVVNLAERGQHVTFQPDRERTPELTDEERAQTCIVKTVDGEFVRLAKLSGEEFGWFKAAVQLAPARAVEENNIMDPKKTDSVEQQAAQFSARVAQHFTNTGDWTKAFTLAQREDSVGAEAYRLAGGGGQRVEAAPAPMAINLSVRPGETHDDLCRRVATERGIPLKQAAHEVGMAYPDLAATRG